MSKTQTVFITGASSGIGLALSEQYLNKGYQVCILARRLAPMIAFKDSCANPKKVLPLQCDVSKSEEVKKAVNTCLSEFGGIDILIANAGIGIHTPANRFNAELIKKVMDINYMGMVYCIESVLPSMRLQKQGQIVGISSLAGYRGLPNAGAYCASKAAMISFLESLRLDLNGSGIQVSIINPGFIDTAITQKNLYKMPQLMSLESGTKEIFEAIQKKKAIYAFPNPLAWFARGSRFMPVSLYDRFFKNRHYVKKN